MTVDEKLRQVDLDLEKGFKKRAIDRLNSLIKAHPNELTFRRKLGQIYLDIDFLDKAGQYLILEKDLTDKMIRAVDIYLDSVNKSGYKILNDIQFQGDKNLIPDYARQKLIELELWSKNETGTIPKFKKFKKRIQSKRTTGWDLTGVIVVSVFILIIVLTIIGLVTVVKWIF